MAVLWLQATTNGNTSGYAIGVVSPTNVIFNNAAQDAVIAAVSPAQTLSLCSFYGTPGYAQASPLSFTVFGALSLQNSSARHGSMPWRRGMPRRSQLFRNLAAAGPFLDSLEAIPSCSLEALVGAEP